MELCGESARETEHRFAAVTAATGALGPVLVKLAALLGDRYMLQEGTRGDIESIKSKLEPVHHLLGKLWGRLDLDVSCMDWMTECRELSYDMEDGVDSFTDGLEFKGGDGSFFIQRGDTDSRPFKEFMERVKDVSKRFDEMQKIGDAAICKLTTDPRALFLHKDASELVGMEEKKQKLIKLLQKHEMVCIVGPGGMGKTTLADLVYQTLGDEFQCRAFVSVHPSPNMTEIMGSILKQVTVGATKSAGSGTQPSAEQTMVAGKSTISVSEKSGTEPAAEQNDFINGLSNFLSDKRYIIILDDIWHKEEWEVIRKALPKNNLSGKLILTTRVRSIAEKCRAEQGAGVYRQRFDGADAARLSAMRLSKSVEGTNTVWWLSTKIADMCGEPPFYYCPLAVICLSSAWTDASHHHYSDGEWDTAWASHILDDGFLSTLSLKPLVQSICLGFDDLPVELRTCLLHCAMYPPEYWIGRDWLVGKWVAEGFASQVDVADSYLEKLVSRNLLYRYMGMYTLHPIMRAFLERKAKQDNFIAYYDGPPGNSSSHAKLQIRRLSLISSTEDRYLDKDVLFYTRSLVVCGHQCRLDGVPFQAFKKLQVLEILDCTSLENGHLVDICGLIRLRYLRLKDCNVITELPREIGRLHNLETLHVRGTSISKLPMEIIGKLEHLETLDVSGTKVTELPTWIEILQSLKTLDVSGTDVTELPAAIGNLERLETLNISRTRVRELPKEIRKLQHLRTFDVRGTNVRELSCSKDPNSLLRVVFDIDKISGEKVMLPLGVISSRFDGDVISFSEAEYREYLSILVLFNNSGDDRCEVRPVAMLSVAGRHMKVPLWVKQDLRNVCSLDISLYKLVEEDLEFLKWQMPNLQALQLRFEFLPQEPFAITGGGFSKLETFYVDCRLPRVITFQHRAMPKLKHLEFKFYTGTASQDYSMGIKHLDSLQDVVFRCSEYYTSDGPGISATIEVVRKEAAEHPNEITLWVVGKEPEVFRTDRSGIRPVVKDIVQVEFEGWLVETEYRKIVIQEKARHICEQRHRLLTAVERRAEREKSSVVIEKEIRDQFASLDTARGGWLAFLQRNGTASQQENNEWEIEERIGRARDRSLRLLTEAEMPAERKKNNAEIEKEFQVTVRILEKSFAENMKKKHATGAGGRNDYETKW